MSNNGTKHYRKEKTFSGNVYETKKMLNFMKSI